ncbi:hypothetical protein D3C84_1239880 [compost metagenome]
MVTAAIAMSIELHEVSTEGGKTARNTRISTANPAVLEATEMKAVTGVGAPS